MQKCSNITEPLAIVWTQMDPIKDFILVVRMVATLGGPLIVLNNPELLCFSVSISFHDHLDFSVLILTKHSGCITATHDNNWTATSGNHQNSGSLST